MKSWDFFLVNFGITNIKVIHLWKVFIQSDLQTVAYRNYSLCEHLLYSVFCILYSVFSILYSVFTFCIAVALRLSQEQEAARLRREREEEEEIMRRVLELSLREK